MMQHLVVFDLDLATSMLLDQSCRTRKAFDNPTPPRTGAPVLTEKLCDVTLSSSVIRLSGNGRAYHVLTFHELFVQPPPWYPAKVKPFFTGLEPVIDLHVKSCSVTTHLLISLHILQPCNCPFWSCMFNNHFSKKLLDSPASKD